MKKYLPFAITLSVLLGIVATAVTTRVVGHEKSTLVKTCGYSVSSETQQQTALKGCSVTSYGWPAKYVSSGVSTILRDFRTVDPTNPTDASSIAGYTSFSRLRFVIDWAAWSVAAGVVVLAVCAIATTKPSKPKVKTARVKTVRAKKSRR